MAPDVADAKAALRRQVQAALAALPPARRALEEELVTAAVQTTPEWKAARTILLYRSLGTELSTVGLVNAAWRTGKRTLFPRQTPNGLTLHEAGSWASFSSGKHGIAEPTSQVPIEPAAVDLAFIPGVAFDVAGRRLGRGGGDFDRLLPRLRLAWGLAFDVQMMDEIPTETHDQRVQHVICAADVV